MLESGAAGQAVVCEGGGGVAGVEGSRRSEWGEELSGGGIKVVRDVHFWFGQAVSGYDRDCGRAASFYRCCIFIVSPVDHACFLSPTLFRPGIHACAWVPGTCGGL